MININAEVQICKTGKKRVFEYFHLSRSYNAIEVKHLDWFTIFADVTLIFRITIPTNLILHC